MIAPSEIEKREFGFGNERKIDYRHYAFRTEEQLKKHFVENTPLYGSFSAAIYEFPDGRPMTKKNMLGADLIFEFDAPCTDKCSIACHDHLGEAKANTIRLIEDFLIPDFGFKKEDITTMFSGARGYHIHVRNDDVRRLPSMARKEIIDYLQPSDTDVIKIMKTNPKPTDKGWKGKFANAVYQEIEHSEDKRFKDKKHVLEQIGKGNYDLLKGPTSYFKKLLEPYRVDFGADIDRGVTLDIHKLIRIPSTIHGGSSLLCMNVVNLDGFDPFKDSIVFHNPPVKIKTKQNITSFILNDQTFGPFDMEKEIELPEYAAMFLMCKKAAMLA